MTKQKEETVLFGKFALDRLLGKGSFAKVYLARNLRTGDSVAIKVISKKNLEESKRKKESKCKEDVVKQEISIMKTLNHPNIVQLYQVMASKNNIYLVMEYVNGGTVFQKLRSGGKKILSKEEENTRRRCFQHLISAVDFCHRKGIYHRDIKSDNLLLDNRGNLKLADFGLSTFQEYVGNDSLFHSVCGAPSRVAPEVLKGAGYAGARADIWSCGVILHEIFVGDTPFHYNNNLRPLLKKMLKRDYSFPTRVPCEVRELLFRFLDPNPDTRITIPEIMDNPWFKVGFNGNNLSLHHGDSNGNLNISGQEVVDFPNSPCMTAFSVLASWPSGLDLAPLFEGSKGLLRFMSKQPVSAIISKFQEIAKANGFSFRRREGTVNMEGTILGLEAKIFEVAPSLYAVAVSNTGEDTPEYEKFRDRHMIPALQDIGWAWRVTPKRENNETGGVPILPLLVGFVCTFTIMSLRAWAKRKTGGRN